MPPFADRELPADFEISPIAPRKYGRPFGPDNPSPGKPKGCIPKITRDLKEGIVEAAERVGSDGQGTGGLTGFLEDLARHHKRAFASLLVKLLPLQVAGTGTLGTHIGTVNVISVPVDHYLSAEDIERMRAPGLAIDHVSPAEPAAMAQEIEPRSPEEASLVAELRTLSREELMRRAGVTDVDRR
jgi:hypothetical protein